MSLAGVVDPFGRRALWLALPPFAVAKLLGLAFALLAAGTLQAAFLHWDSVHYLYIAARGYPRGGLDFHDALMPGFPILVRAVQSALDPDQTWAGLIAAAVGQVLAFFWLARILLLESATDAARRLWLLALFPAAVFLGLIYSESWFVATAAASIYYARAGHLGRAAAWGALACAIRPVGIALLAVLLVELTKQPAWRTRRALLIALVPLPIIAYAAFMALWVGDPLAYAHAQALPIFGTHFAWPWTGALRSWQIWHDPTQANDRRNIYAAAFIAAAIGTLAVGWSWLNPRFPRSLAAYCTVSLALIVCVSTWRSTIRYELALFPLVLLPPSMNAWARPALVIFAGGFALAAYHFAQGGWLG